MTMNSNQRGPSEGPAKWMRTTASFWKSGTSEHKEDPWSTEVKANGRESVWHQTLSSSTGSQKRQQSNTSKLWGKWFQSRTQYRTMLTKRVWRMRWHSRIGTSSIHFIPCTPFLGVLQQETHRELWRTEAGWHLTAGPENTWSIYETGGWGWLWQKKKLPNTKECISLGRVKWQVFRKQAKEKTKQNSS